ncbi:3-hydroxylacyl-ACP dehydratase [Aliidiomarina sp. Khilg15.8]
MTMPAIEDLLPHRPPMILLTALLDFDADSVRCVTRVTADSPFFDTALEGVPAYIGIEYMAQTVAAWAGAKARGGRGEKKLGFLLGTRRYAPQVSVFPCGVELVIDATQVLQDDSGLGVYDCSIHSDNELWASARLNVFHPDTTPSELLES